MKTYMLSSKASADNNPDNNLSITVSNEADDPKILEFLQTLTLKSHPVRRDFGGTHVGYELTVEGLEDKRRVRHEVSFFLESNGYETSGL